jgi:hypothetical protein
LTSSPQLRNWVSCRSPPPWLEAVWGCICCVSPWLIPVYTIHYTYTHTHTHTQAERERERARARARLQKKKYMHISIRKYVYIPYACIIHTHIPTYMHTSICNITYYNMHIHSPTPTTKPTPTHPHMCTFIHPPTPYSNIYTNTLSRVQCICMYM